MRCSGEPELFETSCGDDWPGTGPRASPVTCASLRMLQAIERVGAIDRAAAIEELQTGTFETILGPVKLENNLYTENWWVGQWQNGEFHGIAPATLPGAQG